MAIWVARAGKHGGEEDLALEQGRAFIGWTHLGDLSDIHTREQIRELLEKKYPDWNSYKVGNHTGQIFRFIKEIQVGDLLALPLKKRPTIAFGEVVGDYEYIGGNPESAHHSRKVKWKSEPIPRSAFDKDLLYAFGSLLTVFRVNKNKEDRIKAVIEGKPQPEEETDNTGDEEQALPDLAQLAHDQVSDFIGYKFKSHRMEDLVAEVLKAQGFEVRPNPRKGSDGGVDILAGRGSMGFDEPRLCVQVKSGDTPINSTTYNELKGVMQKFGATHGLLVSWGGFNRNVEEEAKRDFFNIRLWNAEDLVNEIQDVYSNLPKEIQAELPMQQIWLLVDED
ncbi:MAG: restriction endonuclease [Candidatus Dadabacteria bacterium]|nr:restriction endonuclease [Candidatus Dadabacteria bacterium]